jgi:hypothetical protein
MNLSLLGMIATCLFALAPAGESNLCQPAYALDDVVRLPMQSYVPQPGDIFMATDQRIWYRIGHTIAGAHGVHHSGIVIAKPDGSLGLIEAGPFDSLIVEIMDPYEHMSKHVAAGDSVWVRRRRVPLSPDQSARLTAFACAQEGKPFAVIRWLGQLTPLRCRGPLSTWYRGEPEGHRPQWFCSELVTECCVAAGLMDRARARPTATYPCDLFFGRSYNLYLNRHLGGELQQWCPPSRWLPASLIPPLPSEQH